MNETLKGVAHIGAELAAAKADLQLEMERHRKTWRQLEQVTGLLRRWMSDEALDNPHAIYVASEAALSQQAEPEGDGMCNFGNPSQRCVCREEFGHRVCGEPAPAQDERSDELDAIHQYAFEIGGTEGGSYVLEPEELDEVMRRANEPFEDAMRSLACFLGAGGYNAPEVDPAVFEQKIRWGIDQLTRPAQAEQTEQQPEQEPFWYAVVSEQAPRINSAIRRLDVAQEFAESKRERWPDTRVVPLYAAPQPEQSVLVMPVALASVSSEYDRGWSDHAAEVLRLNAALSAQGESHE